MTDKFFVDPAWPWSCGHFGSRMLEDSKDPTCKAQVGAEQCEEKVDNLEVGLRLYRLSDAPYHGWLGLSQPRTLLLI